MPTVDTVTKCATSSGTMPEDVTPVLPPHSIGKAPEPRVGASNSIATAVVGGAVPVPRKAPPIASSEIARSDSPPNRTLGRLDGLPKLVKVSTGGAEAEVRTVPTDSTASGSDALTGIGPLANRRFLRRRSIRRYPIYPIAMRANLAGRFASNASALPPAERDTGRCGGTQAKRMNFNIEMRPLLRADAPGLVPRETVARNARRRGLRTAIKNSCN
jgi:hypothetical protein